MCTTENLPSMRVYSGDTLGSSINVRGALHIVIIDSTFLCIIVPYVTSINMHFDYIDSIEDKATPIDLVDEPKESCTGTRRTEACVAPSIQMRHVTLFLVTVLFILFVVRALCFILVLFTPPSSLRAPCGGWEGCWGGGGEKRCALPDFLFLLLYFPCSADHEEWDWPPCKVAFSGWQHER